MKYSQRYQADKRNAVYPAEFVVRAFLGTYPSLTMPKHSYAGQRVLDLGYGDGRNMPLLRDLGMRIHGVEISEAVSQRVRQRLRRMRIKATLKTGHNADIPYPKGYFPFLLSCHSCYYVQQGNRFESNLAEIVRVMAPDGIWVASFPMTDTYILKRSKKIAPGHYQITQDPYGVRKGVVFRAFASEKEIRKTLAPFFHDIRVGFCDDSYWGIRQKIWIVVCRRRKNKKEGSHAK